MKRGSCKSEEDSEEESNEPLTKRRRVITNQDENGPREQSILNAAMVWIAALTGLYRLRVAQSQLGPLSDTTVADAELYRPSVKNIMK